MDRQHILDEIRRTAEENGGEALGKGKFLKETGIKESDWSGRFWARWSDAVIEAGFTPNEMQGRYDVTKLMGQYAEAVEHLGKIPTNPELRMYSREHPGFPSHGTVHTLGPKAGLAGLLLEHADELELSAEVVAICEAEAAEGGSESESAEELSGFGFVYLIKSGKHYKIGRSNDPSRRAYEIRLQMPENVTVVHEIETDDPAGIEAYWHRRFAGQRANGEWFALSRDDVRTFRSRKTM